eukprot:TRINITY_DN963_c0_g1_i1.p1 TRINITY_DN963_c0_g1~~TRINITY_DN963_c0_g1_i1.p1  ORF type:complete len:561 (+),score=213.61 TRINITY_DN963_c0_g1_i1:93-1685(+)
MRPRTTKSNANYFLVAGVILFLIMLSWFTFRDPQEDVIRTKFENIARDSLLDNQGVILSEPFASSRFEYGVVLDLGSSGSRVYVYRWEKDATQECTVGNYGENGIVKLLPDPVFKTQKVKPGVSFYADTPLDAAISLRPLLDKALNHVPVEKLTKTPIFLYATAGLRVLAENRGEELPVGLEETTTVGRILGAVRSVVANYPFQFDPVHNVRVLDGKEEGTFDWLTVQQLVRNRYDLVQADPDSRPTSYTAEKFRMLNHLGTSWNFAARGYPVGTMDLGGASTQLAFSLSAVAYDDKVAVSPKDVQSIKVFHTPEGTTADSLFVHSFLHYGIIRARERLISNLIEKVDRTDAVEVEFGVSVLNPCMNKRSKRPITYLGDEYTLIGTSDPSTCILEVSKLFDVKERRLDGVYIPPFPAEMRFVAFDHASRVSENLGIEGFYQLSEFLEKATDFCRLDKDYGKTLYPNMNDIEFENLCFESVYLYSLLHVGYSIPDNQSIVAFGDYLNEYELNWGLGAMVHEAHRLCAQGKL